MQADLSGSTGAEVGMIFLVKPGTQEELRVSDISLLLGIKRGSASGVKSSTQTYNPVPF
jgi:hypothetical protein